MAEATVYSIYNGRFPGERAAALFAAKEAESLADAGAKVTLLVPRRLGRAPEDPFRYFGIKKNFDVEWLPVVDFFHIPVLKKVAFYVAFFSFALSVRRRLRTTPSDAVIVSNESLPLLFLPSRFMRTIYEVHDYPEQKRWFYARLFRKVGKILATNAWKKTQLMKDFHLPEEKIFVLPNGVDLKEFALQLSKEEARKRLGLDQAKKYAVYTGHLYSWKGVDTLAEAAKQLPDIEVLFVGGREENIKRFREKYKDVQNIRLMGQRPHAEIPLWQCAADVLVLPNTAKEEISVHYTSPMKLFEYMASGRPIVASRIPSITEHLDDACAFFAAPDEPENLSKAIAEALSPIGNTRAIMSRKAAEGYAWEKRAGRILSGFSTSPSALSGGGD